MNFVVTMTVGRLVVGWAERWIRDTCSERGVEVSFKREHGFFSPNTQLHITLSGGDPKSREDLVKWICDPNTWKASR